MKIHNFEISKNEVLWIVPILVGFWFLHKGQNWLASIFIGLGCGIIVIERFYLWILKWITNHKAKRRMRCQNCKYYPLKNLCRIDNGNMIDFYSLTSLNDNTLYQCRYCTKFYLVVDGEMEPQYDNMPIIEYLKHNRIGYYTPKLT